MSGIECIGSGYPPTATGGSGVGGGAGTGTRRQERHALRFVSSSVR